MPSDVRIPQIILTIKQNTSSCSCNGERAMGVVVQTMVVAFFVSLCALAAMGFTAVTRTRP